jgi:C-terminal processing protease CtpA/Prc
VNGNTEKALLYRAWVADRRAYVEKISNGRLGYIHMLDMGGNAIPQMNLDLDSENHGKEGVVLDLRNNNGGSVNGHALDVLSRQPYVLMVRRGVPPVPGRPVLGQRALEAPTILVINQHTLSDGENFTEGYRTMKLGKVVGEPTAQWDVYTGGGTMIDGTSVRLPFMTNAALDGSPLELKSRQVDIPVDRPLGESYTGRDSQLDTAVKELLAQIGTKSAKRPAATGK